MNSVTLFELSWNAYNGTTLILFGLELKNRDFALFGMSLSMDFLIFYFLTFKVTVFDKTEKP